MSDKTCSSVGIIGAGIQGVCTGLQLLKKNRKIELDQVSKKMFFNNLSKIGYAMKKNENSKNRKFNNYVVKAFQRRFRQELVNGKLDKECFIISNNLAKKFS